MTNQTIINIIYNQGFKNQTGTIVMLIIQNQYGYV